MTQYQRGANFERLVKKKWEENGYYVIRSAGSHGIADLVAIKGFTETDYWTADPVIVPAIVLIQCKLTGKMSKEDETKLKDLATELGVKSVMAYKDDDGKYLGVWL